jgi:hypothetical protein
MNSPHHWRDARGVVDVEFYSQSDQPECTGIDVLAELHILYYSFAGMHINLTCLGIHKAIFIAIMGNNFSVAAIAGRSST